MSFQSMFPEADLTQVPEAPKMAGRPHFGKNRMATLRRQQLSDIAVAYRLQVNPDATKDDLLIVITAAEQQGVFDRPPHDRFRLTKAALNPDQWKDHRDQGKPMPPFEDPEVVPMEPNSYRALQQRCKAAGIDSYGKSAEQMKAALAEAGR